ncbi:MAG: DUF6145 family protein [Cellulosilyticaceae bacterium]
MDKQLVICASPYQHKYYFEPTFEDIPSTIKEELIEAVSEMAEKINGIISIRFNEMGEIFIDQTSEENILVDEIGAELEVKKFQVEKRELIKSLKMWYMIYRTEYGKIVREIVLMQAKELSEEAIIREIESKYGKESAQFAMNLLG